MNVTTENPSASLETALAPLDDDRAATLRASFGAMFDKLDEWREEADRLVVTAADQVGKMKRARLVRLEIKQVRVSLDKKRKELKAGILLEGRAIEGAFAIFESLASPIETHLKEQETFAERAEATRRGELLHARAAALLALGVAAGALPAALGDMSEEAWGVVLEDAQAAKQAKEEAVRLAEAARVEAARIVAEREAERRKAAAQAEVERKARELEQAAENERLRTEAAARDAELRAERLKSEQAAVAANEERLAREKAERGEAEAKARATHEQQKAHVEREARERAESTAREHAARAQAETTKRAVAGVTPERYAMLVGALRGIIKLGEPASTRAAFQVLSMVGEIQVGKVRGG